MDIQKEFGKRCKEFRIRTGLSQEKFALQIGLDRTYYSSIESGKRNVSIKNLEKIANGLGISLEKFFKGM